MPDSTFLGKFALGCLDDLDNMLVESVEHGELEILLNFLVSYTNQQKMTQESQHISRN